MQVNHNCLFTVTWTVLSIHVADARAAVSDTQHCWGHVCLPPRQCTSASCWWHSRASALWDTPVHQSWHVASRQSWLKRGWLLHLGYSAERTGKERKSIYIAPFCTKVHTKRSGMDHTALPANNTMPAFPSWAFTRCHHHSNWGSRHPIAAHYSFIDPERMKGWVGLVCWPIADGLPT